MNYFGNKLKSKSIAILLITTIIFWLIPSNLIFGESDNNTLELLQQAADQANAALAEAQAAVDMADAELVDAGKNLADARTAIDEAGEGDDIAALELARAEALASRDAAKSKSEKAAGVLIQAQAAADQANAELEACLAEISGEPEEEILKADLNVSADPQNVEPGGSITYKITVTNTGNVVLSDIKILDKFPELVIFEQCSTGEFNKDLKEISYTIENLEPGGISEEEIMVSVPVIAKKLQTLTNSVIISSDWIAPIEKHVDVVVGESVEEEDGESGEEDNENESIDEENQQDENEEGEAGGDEEEAGEGEEGTIGDEELDEEVVEEETGEEGAVKDGESDGDEELDEEVVEEETGEENTRQVDNPLYLSVSDSPDPAAAGQNVTYTINYANNGEELLTGVAITSYIPEKTTFISASGGGELRGEIVVWDIGELAAGESGTVTVTVSIPEDSDPTAIYYNIVIIDSIETEPVSEVEQTLDPATQTFYVFGWAPDILELLSSKSAPSYVADPTKGIHSILSISNAGDTSVIAYLKNYADKEDFNYEEPTSNEKVLKITIEPGEVFTIDDLIDINYAADPNGNWESKGGSWKLAGGDFLYVIGGAVNIVRGFAPVKVTDGTDGNVLAEFWNLYPTRMWDDNYIIPVGVDTYDNTSGSGHGEGRDMEYTDLLIQAMENGTEVTIHDPVTGVDTVVELDEGENYIYKSPVLSSYFTNLRSGIGVSDTTIFVNSNSQFAYSGYIKIESEIIHYTSKTSGGWWWNKWYAFGGCTRGVLGTFPASHSTGIVVNQYGEYSSVHQNTTISSNKPVQAGLMTSGGGNVDTRNYNLTANKLIGTEFSGGEKPEYYEYYIPVDTGTNDRLYIYAFKDNTEVKIYSSNTSYKTIRLNAGQVDSSYIMPSGKAVYIKSNEPVQILGAADSNDSDKDWGFQAILVKYYSSEYVVPYAPGNDKSSPRDASWNPLYVTPVEDGTRVFVDWNGDGIADKPYSGAPNYYIDLNRFDIGKLWDPGPGGWAPKGGVPYSGPADGDNGGAYIWAENSVTRVPVKIVVYYGEQSGAHSQQGYDWGYSLIPLSPEFKYDMSLDKEADREVANIGDTITYTFTVENTGNSPIYDVIIDDPMFSSYNLESGNPDPLDEGKTAVFQATYVVQESDLKDTNGDGEPDPIENTAIAKGSKKNNGQKNVFSNEATETVDIIYTASIEIVKSGTLDMTVEGDPQVANAGDTITYKFTVKNTGNVTLTGVTVTDPLVTVLGEPITLAPSASDSTTFTGTYTLTQADINAGKVDNTATATGTDPLNKKVTDTDSETVDIVLSPAISVTKSANPNPAEVGSTITYTYTVKNEGNVTLYDVTCVDTPLGTVTLSGLTDEDSDGVADDLKVGASASGTLTHTVTEANLPGPIENTVTATGTPPVGEDVSDTDTETVDIIYNASIAVTKTPSTTTATVGDTITYTYIVTNTGNVTLTELKALDNRLGGVTFDKTTLAPGETATGTLKKVVSESDLPGPIDNRVDATALDPLQNEVTGYATASVNLIYTASIAVTKTPSTTTATVGDTITHTYIVTNTGNVTLKNVTLSDDRQGDPITLDLTELAPGKTAKGEASHTVTEDDLVSSNPYVNVATAKGEDPVGNEVSATDSASVVITSEPGISVTKTPSTTTATVGDTITYTYKVENTGNVTLKDLKALDNRLGGVTFDKTTLAPGETATGTLQKVVSESDLPGPIENRVDASALDPLQNEVTGYATASVELYYKTPAVTRGSITLNKSGLGSTDVAGFTLYDSKGNAVGGEKKITGNGTVKWSDLRRDTYKIVETTVPSEYSKMQDITDIVVSSSKLNHSFDRTNTKVPAAAMIQVLGIQELPFTGLNPAIPVSGMAMVILSLKRNKYNDL
jgi:uncharacterized repeat protein (TIGR01451 family)